MLAQPRMNFPLILSHSDLFPRGSFCYYFLVYPSRDSLSIYKSLWIFTYTFLFSHPTKWQQTVQTVLLKNVTRYCRGQSMVTQPELLRSFSRLHNILASAYQGIIHFICLWGGNSDAIYLWMFGLFPVCCSVCCYRCLYRLLANVFRYFRRLCLCCLRKVPCSVKGNRHFKMW